jgi:hypothetical protein
MFEEEMPEDGDQQGDDPVQRGVDGLGKVLKKIFRF